MIVTCRIGPESIFSSVPLPAAPTTASTPDIPTMAKSIQAKKPIAERWTAAGGCRVRAPASTIPIIRPM